MTRPTIIYTRHGQTDWNAELRFQGVQDIPLNDVGRSQAVQNGRKLKEILTEPEAFDFISSPLWRSRETMEIMRREMSLPPEEYLIDERLIEASYGELEGTTLAEFKAKDRQTHRERKKNRWHFQPPGGESHQMVLERITEWHNGLERDAMVSAHGVVGRALRRLLIGIEPQEAASFVFPQDKIFIWRDGKEEQV
ncbi:MAG: histidine phosphatase family protein [Pseudomonadota bacterium]